MKIDINPTIQQATAEEKMILDIYNQSCYYIFYSSDGESVSVKFSPKTLEEFIPNKTVSQVMEMWQEGYKRQYEEAVHALEVGLSPWRTKSVYKDIVKYGHVVDKEYIGEEPAPLTDDGRKHYEGVVSKLSKKLGQISFVKIVV